ncbi:CHASE2 domain-containing protein [Methylobacterium nonmethylotrophicum]|uniref:Adenylate/guanylate cyclase domain-containing protein n=1 Tax=Methylobacterium nonmethylotrophicum TaxID=1141884 RepID=A0A4Z0NQX8_9HYPH|nr:adenylate/guanylate cyclase domain-containing protein [Methylobacterium nonmethylotrophicum]TGD99432.1 adenylate/guanylate cyclase domain-containing protein [Methylobacterium nonmethylotrophicum]
MPVAEPGARRRRIDRRFALLALAAVLGWSGWLAQRHVAGRATLLDRAESALTDLRLRLAGPRPPPAGLVIVAIDDETVRREGGFPVARATMARLIEGIAAARPRTLAIDVLFLEAGRQPEADRALHAALARAPTVLAAAAVFEDGASEAGIPVAAALHRPAPEIGAATASGLVNVSEDAAGVPRHLPLVVRTGEAVAAHFVLRAASLAARTDPVVGEGAVRIGATTVPLDLGRHLPLRPYGPRRTIPTLSAAALLDGTVPASALADRVVVVGATALGGSDTFATAFDPVLPGVELLATGIAHLMTGGGLVRDAGVRRLDAAASVLLAAAAALLIALAPPGPAIVLALLLLAGWLAAGAVAFAGGTWWSAALPLAAAGLPVLPLAAARQALDRRRAAALARSEEALRRLQPAALADRLAWDPAYLAEPVARDIPVLFIDLTGFTRQSERLGPVRTRAVLKAFHDLVDATASGQGGLVVNFMGDGAMVVFGALDPDPAVGARAVAAAEDLIARTAEWIAREPELAGAGRALDVRIGAHHGPVILSRLGSDTNQHITATGDTVNVASRLLAVASEAKARLAVSADLLAAAGIAAPGEHFDERRVTAIRGRAQTLEVWLGRGRLAS